MIYDITRTIDPHIAVWPGDSPFGFDVVARRENDQGVNLTTLHLSAHTGTHADAPWHFDNAGAHPADAPLDRYIGPARVVSISRQHGGITPDDLNIRDLGGIPRLLLRTWVSDLPDNQWPQDFPYPTPALVEWLTSQNAVLLGVDMPSVDAFTDPHLTCHHLLNRSGVSHLETLNLSQVPDGEYELIALPLKIAGVCGSPVRAVLRTLD